MPEFGRVAPRSPPWETQGWVKADGVASIEDVAANLDTIVDASGYYVSRSLDDWMGTFMGHVAPPA